MRLRQNFKMLYLTHRKNTSSPFVISAVRLVFIGRRYQQEKEASIMPIRDALTFARMADGVRGQLMCYEQYILEVFR